MYLVSVAPQEITDTRPSRLVHKPRVIRPPFFRRGKWKGETLAAWWFAAFVDDNNDDDDTPPDDALGGQVIFLSVYSFSTPHI